MEPVNYNANPQEKTVKISSDSPVTAFANFNSELAVFQVHPVQAKGLADDSSDIDVVELNSPIDFGLMELCEYLEDVPGGKVDVLTSEGVKQVRLHDIAKSIEKDITYV